MSLNKELIINKLIFFIYICLTLFVITLCLMLCATSDNTRNIIISVIVILYAIATIYTMIDIIINRNNEELVDDVF